MNVPLTQTEQSKLQEQGNGECSRSNTDLYYSYQEDSDDKEFDTSRNPMGCDFSIGSASDEEVDNSEPLSSLAAKGWMKDTPGTTSFVWQQMDNTPQHFQFAGSPGVKANLDKSSTPFDIFKCFFTDDVIDIIVRETNSYASSLQQADSHHMKNWIPTSRDEVLAFLGLRVLMGLQPRTACTDYWSTNPLLRCEIFSEVMPRDRFRQLISSMHFSHLYEGERVPKDQIWELQPILNALNESFLSTFVPEKDITIEESVWKLKKSLAFQNCKPTKWPSVGLKAYSLSALTGSAAGYTSCFSVYAGKDMPSPTDVVLQLMDHGKFMDKGYHLYVDSWYTSPTLFHILQSQNTNAVGTAKLWKKFMPKDLQVISKGDMDYRSSGTGMLALQWNNHNHNKVISMLSTLHTAKMVGGEPLVVADYNRMKQVKGGHREIFNMNIHRSAVWYMNIFFHLVHLSINNAFAVHRTLGGALSEKNFRLELISALLGTFRTGSLTRIINSKIQNPHASKRLRLDERQHFIKEIPENRRRRCRWCSELGIRKNTKSFCSDCNVGLCTYGCFEAWHTSK